MTAIRRVMIIGGPGSGKSTLAQWIGRRLALPVVHLDQIYWKPGWVLRADAEVADRLADLYAGESWVIEGNYPASWDRRMARCDCLVMLDLPTWLRLWRVCVRTLRTYGRVRPDLAPGCPERLDLGFLGFVLNYRRDRRDEALARYRTAPGHVARHLLTSPAEIERFLARIGET